MENTFRRHTEDLLGPICSCGVFPAGPKGTRASWELFEPHGANGGSLKIRNTCASQFRQNGCFERDPLTHRTHNSMQSLLVVSSCKQQVKDEENWLVKLNIGKRKGHWTHSPAQNNTAGNVRTCILSANQGRQFKISFLNMTHEINEQDSVSRLTIKAWTQMH